MEWVETTAKTIDAAREAALDQLGVGLEDAEFDVLEEPKPGLFGRMRGEARLRARVRPAQVRQKQERRRRGRSEKPAGPPAAGDGTSPQRQKSTKSSQTDAPSKGASTSQRRGRAKADVASDVASDVSSVAAVDVTSVEAGQGRTVDGATDEGTQRSRQRSSQQREQVQDMDQDEFEASEVPPEEVGAAAVAFMEGLTDAFGLQAVAELTIDGTVLEVNVAGAELGLLVGPGGRTLNAVQDLARVAAQRRLGDHETRLRVDVAGYRGRREQALVAFSRQVAEQVRASGVARSLEPMTSSDRKVIHDALNDEPGVASRSVGEDPTRRIVVEPV